LADDGFAGGVFLGWRHRVNDARFGIEVGAELADVDWVHDADRTFSVKRSDLYSISAIAGLDLSGGSFAYLRGGLVNANLETNYCEDCGNFTSNRRALGARLGVGIEAPVTAGLSARLDYVVTAWDDHDAGVGTSSDNFADAEGMARLGLIWRFGAEADIPKSDPVEFGGFYVGALFGHGALMSENVGDRDTFTLDAQRAGFGAGFGVVAGYGMIFGTDFYVGAEVDAEISSVNWTQERAPSGRVYSIEKTHSFGASLRVGYVVNDGMLIYARGGPVISGFDTDFATSSTSTESTEDKVGLRISAGIEVSMSESLRLRFDYTHTEYDDFGISYGSDGRDEFDNSENQFRIGVLYSF
jgi:opacity protein-like surface antigen